jgi:hypothetical protein
MMDEIEPMRGLSADEPTPTIERIGAAGDFRFANRRGRADLGAGKQDRQRQAPKPDDEVALSAIAQVSLLEEEGLSVPAIAAELGLNTEQVLIDGGIAAEICHPSGSQELK